MISKELFIATIEAIRSQVNYDKINGELIEGMFPGSQVTGYGNHTMFKTLISLLQVWFPRDENNHCEIEHYCFVIDFGRWDKNEVVTVENLWDQLTKDFK